MFQNSGLSLDQAPPIKVVLRFFLSGSIFGVVAGIFLFFFNNDINSNYALILTHLLTLGVMASFMFGALFQMLPVLGGVHIKAPTLESLRVNYTLIFGLIFLLNAFYFGYTALYIFASLFLGFAIFKTAYLMLKELKDIEHNSSSRGMAISLVSLSILAIIGIVLLYIRAGYNINLDYIWLKSMHFSFGLFGWIALLIISVSFQVIEMFYVTPPYNKVYAKYLPCVILGVLILNFILSFVSSKAFYIFETVTILIVAIHALYTLIRLKQKKRPVMDATIYFWILGLSSFILFALIFIAKYFVNIPTLLLAALFSYFALSIVFAMAYKIVPFLVWFHLNAQGYFDAPMMHEVTKPSYAKKNFYIFFASFILSILASFYPILWHFVSILFTISFFMLLLNIYSAMHKYQYVLKHSKKFELNIK